VLWTRVPSGECNLLMHDTAEGEARCRHHTSRLKAQMTAESISIRYPGISSGEPKEQKAE